MATLTSIASDLAIRSHLATLAKAIGTKFHGTYQGDYVDTVTNATLGDRLQSGIQATIAGVRYLFVLTFLVDATDKGKVSVRVSAWSLADNGTLVGTWPIRRTYLIGVRITGKGIIPNSSELLIGHVAKYFDQAKSLVRNGQAGRPVVVVHTDRNGDNAYSTSEDHLLPFGGTASATARLFAR